MLIIDRFEENIAILEGDGEFIEVEKALLPVNAKEGDVVELQDGRYVVDTEKTAQRRSNVVSRLRKLGL